MQAAEENIRTRILRAALEVIGEKGIGGLSNRAVAARAGVSLGSLTYHFTSQHDLLKASLELFLTQETERLRELIQQLGSQSLAPDQAAAGLEVLLSGETPRRIAKLEMYLQATRDPDLRESTEQCLATYDDLAKAALAATGVSDPGEIAPILVAIIDGLQLRRLATGQDRLALTGPLQRILGALPRDEA